MSFTPLEVANPSRELLVEVQDPKWGAWKADLVYELDLAGFSMYIIPKKSTRSRFYDKDRTDEAMDQFDQAYVKCQNQIIHSLPTGMRRAALKSVEGVDGESVDLTLLIAVLEAGLDGLRALPVSTSISLNSSHTSHATYYTRTLEGHWTLMRDTGH